MVPVSMVPVACNIIISPYIASYSNHEDYLPVKFTKYPKFYEYGENYSTVKYQIIICNIL